MVYYALYRLSKMSECREEVVYAYKLNISVLRVLSRTI